MTSLESGIVTDDVDGLARFYEAAFGFEVISDMTFPQGRVCRLRFGDAALKLFRPAAGAGSRPAGSSWHAHSGFAYAALHVDDADACVERAAGAGASMIVPVTAHRPGARYALVADPEGNVWEILEEAPVRS